MMGLTLAIELITIAVGTGMLVWAYRNDGKGVGFAKLIGYVVFTLAVLALLCTSVYGVRYWHKGYFKHPHGMQMKHQCMKCMMHDKPEMKQRMQEMQKVRLQEKQ